MLIVLVTGQALFSSPEAMAQSRGFTVSPLVKRGDRTPDGERFFIGDFPFANLLGLHALNHNGDVVFYTYLDKACASGLYLVSNGKTSKIPDPLCNPPSSGSIRYSGSLLGANLNNNNQVPINLILPQEGFPCALFLYSDGKLERVVGNGDVTPMGTVFSGCGLQYSAGLSDGPAINDKGEIAFYAQSQDSGGNDVHAIFVYSAGEIRKVVATGDSFALGGRLDVTPTLSQTVRINDKGEVLFQGSVLPDDSDIPSFGFFLATQDGIKKIAATPDSLSDAGIFFALSGTGDLNNRGDVVFTAAFFGHRRGTGGGIFLDSDSRISKIATTGDSTPIGGTFGFSISNEIQRPRINNNGAIAFLTSVDNGSATKGIFLASRTAIVKVAAVGDLLPTGKKIGDIFTFGLNDKGQVAFVAYGKVKDPRAINTNVLGLFIATPAVPKMKSIKLKQRSGTLELRITGKAMITNDTVIEIDGVPLNATDYPADFREDGGFTTRVVSRDPRLEQLIRPGQTVLVTVLNPLTSTRSAAVAFTR
jgi:hypothetical protein